MTSAAFSMMPRYSSVHEYVPWSVVLASLTAFRQEGLLRGGGGGMECVGEVEVSA